MATQPYLAVCSSCGRTTSRAYSRRHGGKCLACVADKHAAEDRAEQRIGRLIDHGADACAREDGAYDLPDYA